MMAERRPIAPEERIHSWVALGADPAEARWHAALAAALEAWRDHLIAGRIVTCEGLAPAEARTFEALCTWLDLPPEIAGVFLPRNLSAHFEPPAQGRSLRRAPAGISQLLLLGRPQSPQRLLVAELGAAQDAPGVDLYAQGCRLLAAPLDPDPAPFLSQLAWRHLSDSAATPSSAACRRYTEWWFRRCAVLGRADLPLHPQWSYLHHPERFGFDPLEAVFLLTGAVLGQVCESFRESGGTGRDDLREMVQARLVGLLDLLRRAGLVDFAALRGEAEARFKEGFAQTVARACEGLEI